MIPDIETILEDLAAGRISTAQATAWLYQHAEGAASDLRDHFAGLAMQAMVTAEFEGYDAGTAATRWSTQAYVVADAMLAARSAR